MHAPPGPLCCRSDTLLHESVPPANATVRCPYGMEQFTIYLLLLLACLQRKTVQMGLRWTPRRTLKAMVHVQRLS